MTNILPSPCAAFIFFTKPTIGEMQVIALLGLLLAFPCVPSVYADTLDTLVVFPFNRRAVKGNHITLRGESGKGTIPRQRVDFVEPVTKEVSDVLLIRPIPFEF